MMIDAARRGSRWPVGQPSAVRERRCVAIGHAAAVVALALAGCGGGGPDPLAITMFAPITAEATSPAGASVAVPAPTTNDASATVSCTPATSTAVYAIGLTTFQCRATNAAGEVATGTSSVNVVDTTPPVLNMFAPITVAATSANGATVTVPAVTATDTSGTPTVTCAPSNGPGSFPVGTTPVTCTAVDTSGNRTTATSSVTVLPFPSALTLTMFAPITAEATGPGGATVTVPAPTTNDAGATVSCTPAIGAGTFALGTTTVNCRASNAAGDSATGSSFVHVVDTTPPVLTLFAPITVAATSASGASVTLPPVSAVDIVSTPVVNCDHSGGPAPYPIGTTVVTCTATDAAGNASTANSTVTVTAFAPPASAFRAISAGLTVTCAVTTDGTPYCWGNAGPLLGMTPAPTTPQLTPQPVQTNLKFTTISVSGYFNQGDQTACALTTDGSAYCWGNNGAGQVGDGTTTNRAQATAVLGGHHFVSIATRVDHTCALDTAGAGWCWGTGLNGTLGSGTASGNPQPTPVQVQTSARLVQLSVGFHGGCALTDTQQVLCWGENNRGQLGIGALVPFFSYGPQAVIGLPAMSVVAAGDSQACALDTSGAAWCWGSPSYGAVGDGRTSDTPVTTPVRVAGTNRFAGLSAGFQATCGWTLGVAGSDGSSACWGLNVGGELGDGTTTNRTVPTPVAGTQVFSVIAETVADGLMHACALTASGQAYCWGNNTFGELGDGSTNSHLIPGPVTMP